LVISTVLEIFYHEFVIKATVFIIPTVLGIFYHEFVRNATVLVISTVLEIFIRRFVRKILLLVIPTVLEIFYRQFVRKALLLVILTVLEVFYQKILNPLRWPRGFRQCRAPTWLLVILCTLISNSRLFQTLEYIILLRSSSFLVVSEDSTVLECCIWPTLTSSTQNLICILMVIILSSGQRMTYCEIFTIGNAKNRQYADYWSGYRLLKFFGLIFHLSKLYLICKFICHN
jgi:hypothetical protein